jgi:hypothetical protein
VPFLVVDVKVYKKGRTLFESNIIGQKKEATISNAKRGCNLREL